MKSKEIKEMAFNRWFDEYFCDTQGEESPYSYEDVENAFSIGWKSAEQKTQEEIFEEIDNIENPYPKDIFLWDSKEKLDFNRGRFHQHCFGIWENFREILKAELKWKKNWGEK